MSLSSNVRQDASGSAIEKSINERESLPLPSRRWDITSLSFGLLTFGVLYSRLVYINGTKVTKQEHATTRPELVGLLILLYFFLIGPLSNSLRRIKRSHSDPISPNVLDARYRRPVGAILPATKSVLTFRLFGIASVPVLVAVTAATLIPAPWSKAIIWDHRWNAFDPSEVWHTPTVAIARDINPDRYKSAGKWWSDGALLATLNRGLGGINGAKPYKYEPVYDCPSHLDDFSECRWKRFATLKVRSRCKEAGDQLELAETSSILEALRDVSSLPPYTPLDESRAESTSAPILSYKNTTFITLSNLRSRTGSWTRSGGCVREGERGCQITVEALERLRKFSSLVVNPVSMSKERYPAFNQTAGTVLNFHVIYAELGMTGDFEDGILEHVDLANGTAKAWECSLDTVVEEMHAGSSSTGFYEWGLNFAGGNVGVVLPSNDPNMTEACTKYPFHCPLGADRTIEFLWNNTRYSIDSRVTSSMAEHLETLFAGSSFAYGWQSEDDIGFQKPNSTAMTSTLIHNQIAGVLNSWRRYDREPSPWWEVTVTPVFESVARSLTDYLRHLGIGCWGQRCSSDVADGEVYLGVYLRLVEWKYLWYPEALVGVTLLVFVLAAADEHYCRIRLPETEREDENDTSKDDDGKYRANQAGLENEDTGFVRYRQSRIGE